MNAEQQLLTTREASAILGVTDRRVRQLIDAGMLNGQRFGRDWLFPRVAVEEYAASRESKANRHRLEVAP